MDDREKSIRDYCVALEARSRAGEWVTDSGSNLRHLFDIIDGERLRFELLRRENESLKQALYEESLSVKAIEQREERLTDAALENAESLAAELEQLQKAVKAVMPLLPSGDCIGYKDSQEIECAFVHSKRCIAGRAALASLKSALVDGRVKAK